MIFYNQYQLKRGIIKTKTICRLSINCLDGKEVYTLMPYHYGIREAMIKTIGCIEQTNVLSRYGLPYLLHTDNGTEFI